MSWGEAVMIRPDATGWRGIAAFVAPLKREMMVMIALMTAVAGLESLQPFMTGWVIDNIVVADRLELLPLFLGFYLLMTVALGVLIWLFILYAGRIETGLVYRIHTACFERLQSLSLSYYDRSSAGWIMARITSDTQKIGSIIAWGIVDVSWGTTMMAGMAFLMFLSNWRLALISLMVLPPLIGISLFFQHFIFRLFRRVRRSNSAITAAFNEGILGARTTKTLVREGANEREFAGLTGGMRRDSVRAATLSALYLPSVVCLGSIGTALALWRGGSGVVAGSISYGVLVSFLFATGRFFDPVMELSRVFAEIQYARASAERVASLLNEEPEIRDLPGLKPVAFYPSLRGEVEFADVSFGYGTGQPVLENFSLPVKAGTTVALVGETGAGKSTIVNLLCRFYEPTGGIIRIDGLDYRLRPQKWLHSQIGYVLQTPYLFSGTVADNIRFGRPDATDREVRLAAVTVRADEFIRSLAAGYETEVGPGGNNLSTGQKQLVSFARAILADPRIFVLDEATSSVDSTTEAQIQEAIATLLNGRTSFLVAHRLSTVRGADQIVVVERGRIIETGTHNELLALRGAYSRLYLSQFAQEAEERLLRE